MLTVKSLDFSFLKENIEAYRSLLLPAALKFLEHPPENAHFLIMEAILDQKTVGLLFSRLFSNNRTSQIYSFVVEEAFRRQGIGLKLFQFFQQNVIHEEKYGGIGFEYEANSPYAVAIEKILKQQGWQPPKLYLIRCYFHGPTFNPPWYERHLHHALPPQMHVFPWSEVSDKEKEALGIQSRQGRFLPYLSPLRQEELIEPLNSLGLRNEHTIIGWMITHRLDPQTIRYSALYIENEYLLKGYAIWLLAQSIYRQKQSSVPEAYLEINLKEVDPSWRSFVQKRLIPYAQKVERMKWAIYLYPEYLSL